MTETNSYSERIDELEMLNENWDSYGAVSPNPSAIEQARMFAKALESGRARVFASVNGEVVFSWLDEKVEVRFEGESFPVDVWIDNEASNE